MPAQVLQFPISVALGCSGATFFHPGVILAHISLLFAQVSATLTHVYSALSIDNVTFLYINANLTT